MVDEEFGKFSLEHIASPETGTFMGTFMIQLV